MTDGLKRRLAPAPPDATRSLPGINAWALAPQAPTPDQSPTDRSGGDETGWFEALDPTATEPPPRKPYGAFPLLGGAIAAIAFGNGLFLRAFVPAVLALAALVVLTLTQNPDPARRKIKRRGLSLERSRLWFQSPDPTRSLTLVEPLEPFGVTLLSTPRHDRAVAVLTSTSGTFCVGCSFDAAARRGASHLLDSAFTVTTDESGLEAIGPDGEPLTLAPDDFLRLLQTLGNIDRGCFDRLVLSDARGAPLVLNGGERRELRVGDRVLDLSAPIEWRGIVFQEGLGQAIAVYQGTWIRQGSTEIVLVSLLPSLMSAGAQGIAENGSLAGLDRSVLRDLRLMQAVPEEPPPVEQRVAIDRLFMLPVRYALDRAPRPSKHSMGRAQRQD
ncbi:MAG: IMP dehydrogenase [Polyangiaceae bacterium]|nr:IMP dehydrogenase [Polyangiaceae bacterium]